MNVAPAKTRLFAEHKHDSPLLCCVFDPTGRFVIAGGRDRHLVCFEIASGKALPLEGHETWIGCSAAAGKTLVISADFAGRVVAWDCTGESPQLRWKIDAHAHTIHCLAVSADGQRFASGDRDGTIRVWSTSDGQRMHEIAGIGHPVSCVAFHPDGRQLISADRQPKKPRLKVWDFATGQELRSIDVPQLSAYRRVEDIEWGGIRGLAISADGRTLVASGSNEYSGPACAVLFDSTTGELQRKLSSSLKGFCYAVRYHPQGFLMASSGDVAKGEIRIWNAEKEESLASVATPGPCTAIDIDPDGRRFVAAQTIGKGSYPDSGTLTLYDWSG